MLRSVNTSIPTKCTFLHYHCATILFVYDTNRELTPSAKNVQATYRRL